MRRVLSILAAGVLILLAAVLVLPACGVRFVVGQSLLRTCPVPEARQSTNALDLLHERQRSLFAELRSLERDLGLSSCEPVQPAPPPIAEEPVQPAPPPIAEETPDGIDPDAWNDQDVRLLDGCWMLDGEDYVATNRETGVRTRFTEWEMCFDANGQGEQTLRGRRGASSDSVLCESDTQAAFDSQGRLVISDAANVLCDDNSYIYRRVVTCELVEDTWAQCLSVQPEAPSGGSSQVRLKRK